MVPRPGRHAMWCSAVATGNVAEVRCPCNFQSAYYVRCGVWGTVPPLWVTKCKCTCNCACSLSTARGSEGGVRKSKPNSVRTARKLAAKRDVVLAWLEERGHDVTVLRGQSDKVLLTAAYAACGRRMRKIRATTASLHSHYSNVMAAARLRPVDVVADGARADEDPRRVRTAREAKVFYASYAWRRLRYEVLKRDKQTCQLCGASRATGAVLQADHIKPLRYYWHLRLNPNNVQTMCEPCNHGKGNWDETDWRPPAPEMRSRVKSRRTTEACARSG